MPLPHAEPFFDEQTSTFSYVVYEPGEPLCAIIDAVLDYDPKSGRTSTTSADEIIQYIKDKNLTVQWILETHAHADHVSAAAYLQEQLGGRIAIGEHILHVQSVFKDLFNLKSEFVPDGTQFDHLFHDGERFLIGNLQVQAVHVPGHTPADMAYHIDRLGIFVGDTLFMPDVGTARCDFPGGSARMLYRSIQKILSLDDDTQLYLCHDYPPASREREYCSTVQKQRSSNIHVRDGISEDEFVEKRSARDATLPMPVLILPAIQLNIRAGTLPQPEDNGVTYLKIPLNHL